MASLREKSLARHKHRQQKELLIGHHRILNAYIAMGDWVGAREIMARLKFVHGEVFNHG